MAVGIIHLMALVPPAIQQKFNKSWWSMRLGEFLRLTATPQAKFAAQIGVRQPTVSRLVAGTQNPSALTALKIRDASQGAVGPGDWGPMKKVRRRDALLPGG
jgi:hypothetical protein